MVIPVHDVNPVRRTPWVTYLLIAANVVVFLRSPGAATLNGSVSLAELCHQQAFYDQWGAIPHELVTNHALTLVPNGHVGIGPQGAGCLLTAPGYHKTPVLSAVTAMFLHGSWLHLLGNMLFLWIFGNNIEDRFGHLRYILFYLVCGLIASYGFALVNARFNRDAHRRIRRDRRRARRLPGALPASPGVEPGAVSVLHPATSAGLVRARPVVRAAMGLLRRLRGFRRRIGGLSCARLRLPHRPADRRARAQPASAAAALLTIAQLEQTHGFGDCPRGIDQADVAEGLRKVAEQLAGGWSTSSASRPTSLTNAAAVWNTALARSTCPDWARAWASQTVHSRKVPSSAR